MRLPFLPAKTSASLATIPYVQRIHVLDMPRVVYINIQSGRSHAGLVCSVQHKGGGGEMVEGLSLGVKDLDLGLNTV